MKIRSALFGTTTLVVLLTAGAAQSLSGSNTVTSDDIVDHNITAADLGTNSVTRPALGDGAVSGAEISDNSVTGTDISESTLNLRTPWSNVSVTSPAQVFSDITPQYRIDASGVVHLRGAIQTGASSVMGTLPAGFRPPGLVYFPGNHVSIASTGVMTGDANSILSLNGIIFEVY